ncbi:undecaprenyldiphospho-muramoylpentapeptide beta-N-acetylglucosaminyltransferase [Georgenia sp. 10Sc9-8]|uniref:UDP-N-acetylglucosamine--N-acetylmuramyl-(pentapeptide) pyrophosphoryl-undecaprenol N-acetylglucosamine transferase n=1 Tax=Georgenia halotolerans TaxID=3028317 RepID=A0ABT5TX72_9MICO|nr:undecaprenyldiphospho-muramoylpentapeptide beta-N-acetylglucosaminyltransferase [Georgenia halotolerans]
MAEPLRVLLAGGGTAGHVNPLLATAAELTARPGGAHVAVLGTDEGLESRLVPEAGLDLIRVPRVPLPRRPSADLARLPGRLRAAVRAATDAVDATGAEVVVGFGGYVATPAYLAARRRGLPVVVHEQNARPGLANRLGARWAAGVAVTFPSTPLRAARGTTVVTGMPLRAPIQRLAAELAADPRGRRAAGARALGLDPERPTLLVTGGSLGAQRLNGAVAGCAQDLLDAGAQVLHLTGRDKGEPVRAAAGATGERYQVREYLSEMEHAYACADLVLCRAGAVTVSELAALGLGAVYVPLPIGNGEQRHNAGDVVAAGGGLLVEDAELDAGYVRERLVPLLTEPRRLVDMGRRAAAAGTRDGAARLADLVHTAAGREPREGARG